jgi:cytoskeletal protein RodZ
MSLGQLFLPPSVEVPQTKSKGREATVDTKATRSSGEDATTEGGGSEPTLGQILTAAREKLGINRQQAAQRAHLSLSYVEMLESESYKKVSDQIYLVPFLRRYANSLGLDGEELAMRFVRDFQYTESESARMVEPVMLENKQRPGRRYSWLAIVAAAAAAIALAKLGQSYRREQSPNSKAHSQTSPAGLTAPRKPVGDGGQAPSSVSRQDPPVSRSTAAAMQPTLGIGEDKRSATDIQSPPVFYRAAATPARKLAHTVRPMTPAQALSNSSARDDEDSAQTE